MQDYYGRTIDYLRISVTNNCNLRCTYCMPAWGVPLESHGELSLEQYLKVAKAAAQLGIHKVRITGGEPLMRTGIVDLVQGLKELPGITTIGMTTNGILLKRYAAALRSAGLTHLNISLDTLNPEQYALLTRGGNIQAALNGITAAKEAGFTNIKINTVITQVDLQEDIPEWRKEDLALLQQFCDQNGFGFQRIAEYSLLEEKRDDIRLERPLPCSECNRIRLLSKGVLKPCLHSNEEIHIDWYDIAGSIEKTIQGKPEHGSVCTNRSMVEIGG